ncbi:hypothetical protein [Portibacter marinus]|uniref:hypothetical protein n=1 Tax=Portibacter marinus TaxID=2898660 RepID=UPI001F1DD76D|nr:hypothetical protein [Portibacter marinus]
MPVRRLKRKSVAVLFIVVAIISVFSFTYLNLCEENTIMISQYMGDISYADFRLEQIVLPDLHFFENSFQRIVELIFART